MEHTIIQVNTVLKITSISDCPILIISLESNENKHNTFLIKKESDKESVIAFLNPNETKQLKQTVSLNSELKLLSDNESSSDKIIICYFKLVDNNNINNFSTQHELLEYNSNEDEDEDFEEDEEDSESADINEEEDESLEAESDLAQLANDLWEDCEAQFDNNQHFLGRKRYLN
jgi:hypothetical protein